MREFWLDRLIDPKNGMKIIEVVEVNDSLAFLRTEASNIPVINKIAIFDKTHIDDIWDRKNEEDVYKVVSEKWVAKHRLFREKPPLIDIELSKDISKRKSSVVFLNTGLSGGLFPWVIALNRELEVFLADIELTPLVKWFEFLRKHELDEKISSAVIDPFNLPFEEESIEIVSVSYQEYFSLDKRKEINEISRVLKLGSTLYLLDIVTDAKGENSSETLKKMGIMGLNELTGLLEANGFEIFDVRKEDRLLETDLVPRLLRELLDDVKLQKVGVVAVKKGT